MNCEHVDLLNKEFKPPNIHVLGNRLNKQMNPFISKPFSLFTNISKQIFSLRMVRRRESLYFHLPQNQISPQGSLYRFNVVGVRRMFEDGLIVPVILTFCVSLEGCREMAELTKI